VIQRSGARASRADRKIGSPAFSGENMGIDSWCKRSKEKDVKMIKMGNNSSGYFLLYA
jgi:hypothetical protein